MDIREMTLEEQKYSFAQSQQLTMQCGLVGHLRGDFGSGGKEFYTTWFDDVASRKTQEFSGDLATVVGTLCEGEKGLLSNRVAMSVCCYNHPCSEFEPRYREGAYGFRADTDRYAFLIRCDPRKGDYNFYVYGYEKQWLDRNIEKDRGGIRFINSGYKELFRIPDGGKIQVSYADGTKEEYTCRYIDEYHTEVGRNLFHVCEFAERMEGGHCSYEPVTPMMPETCLSTLPSSGALIEITNGQEGYRELPNSSDNPEQNRKKADQTNRRNGVSKAQEAAMLAGSMFGWKVPAADPKNYDANGTPLHSGKRNRDYER